MDLIPKPDQIVAASANVAQKVLYGGVADLRPMPRTLIDEGTLREVYHYRPRGGSASPATRSCWSPRWPPRRSASTCDAAARWSSTW